MTLLSRFWRSPVLRYGLTFVLLGLIFWKVVNPSQLWSTVQKLSVVHLAVAMLLTIPFLILKAMRWYLLLRAGRCQATFGEAFVSLIGGMGVALLTPARIGEVTRAAYLSEPRKVRVGALVMVDKVYDVVVLALLSVAGAAVLVTPVFALALAAFGAAGVYLALRPRDLRAAYAPIGRSLPFYNRIDKVLAGFAEFSGSVGALCLFYTFLAFVLVLAQYLIILGAWNQGSLEIVVFCFPMVVLTNAVPLTVAGLGTREGAAILLLKHYHVAASIASTSAFLMSFMNTVLPGLIGALITPFARRRPPAVELDASRELAAAQGSSAR